MTLQKLIAVAFEEFSQKGYAAASTETIVARANLTRGALYHHFKNKAGLFLAVFRSAQEEVGRRVEQAADQSPDLWGQLVSGAMDEASVWIARSENPVSALAQAQAALAVLLESLRR